MAFNANAEVVASALKSWSPVLVPEIAASFIFSAVVKSLLDNSFPIILSTLVAMLALIGAKSNVFAASCVGVTYFVVLSAKFTLVVMLALMGAKSKVFAANCVGVTYFVVLSAKFTLVAILTLIGLMSNVFAANWVGVT